MSEPAVYVCRVDTPDGTKDYVTLISPEVAFSQGLAPEAIVGVLLRPLVGFVRAGMKSRQLRTPFGVPQGVPPSRFVS
jgi:hypothetical protein